ncbi:hypothetical protein [Clostridium sp.]|uniref:hypothetical protein n=1 Tax=Clostridium sp. TaxID=1506 RepID=UPI0025BE6C26|nr:hypothetical protein [Clostridium sp.]
MLNKGGNDNITPSNLLNDNTTLTPTNINEDFKSQESPLSSYLSEHRYDIDSEEYKKGKYEKYEVYISPNSTEEDLRRARAENQGVLEQTVRSLGQIVGNEIVLGTIKGFSDIYDAINSIGKKGEPNDFTNVVSSTLEKAQENVRERLEIYRANPDKSFDMSDFGWWADNFVTIGSTLSLMLPSLTVTKGASVVGKALKLDKLSLGVAKSVANVGKRTAKGKNLLFNPINASKEFNALAGASISGLTSRVAENYMEARETYKSAYDFTLNKLNGYNDIEKQHFLENNPQYEGKTNDKIAKDIASKSGSDTFKRDMALVVLDVLQYKSLNKLMTEPLKNTATARVMKKKAIKSLSSPVEEGLSVSLKERVKEAISYSVKHPYEIIKSIPFSEGIEEGWQGISQALSEDYYNAITNPNYSKRSIESLLTDGKIWEQAFWGVLGGLAFEKIGQGAAAIKEEIDKKRKSKDDLINTDINKKKLTEEEIYKADIEAKFASFNKLVSDLNDINNKKINGVKEEDVTDELIKNKKEELIDDFLIDLITSSKDNRTFELFEELINNEGFGKYLKKQGAIESDIEQIANNELSDKITKISNLYENNLHLVLNGIKESDTDTSRAIALDLTRRKLLIDRLTNTNNEIDKKINNIVNNENINLSNYIDSSIISIYNLSNEENEKEFEKHKEEFKNKEISIDALNAYEKEYNRNKKIYEKYLNRLNQERILYFLNDDNTQYIDTQVYKEFDAINQINDETERRNRLNDLLYSITKEANDNIGIVNDEVANLVMSKATNELIIDVQNSLIPQNTKELRNIYDDLIDTIDDFVDKSLTNAFKKVSDYISQSNNPKETYYQLLDNNPALPQDIQNALKKLKLGYKNNEFYIKGIQTILNEELNKRNEELIKFNTTKENGKEVEGKDKKEIDDKAKEAERKAQTGDGVPSTGELTEEEKQLKDEAEAYAAEQKKTQQVSDEELDYLSQEAEYNRDKLLFSDFIIKHINRKEFIESIRNIKQISLDDENYKNVYETIKKEFIEEYGFSETKASIITNENIQNILNLLYRSNDSNPNKRQKFKYLSAQLSNKIIVEQNNTNDLFAATPFIADDQKALELLNNFIMSYFENYEISDNTIDVDKFFENLLNDEDVDYEAIKTIFLNFDKIYKLPNIKIINDTKYKENLKDSVNYFTILQEQKALRENIGSYMHINAPSVKTKEYFKAIEHLKKGNPIYIFTDDKTNAISFRVQLSKNNFVEVGYIIKVKANNTNTEFEIATNPLFKWKVRQKDGKITSNYDKLFKAIFNNNEIKNILINYNFKKGTINKDDILKLSTLINSINNNGKYSNLLHFLSIELNDKNPENTKKIINGINSILFFNGKIATTQEEFDNSYNLWLSKVYSNYESTYALQNKLNEYKLDTVNGDKQKKYLTTKLESLGVPKILYDEELKDANTLPFNIKDNPLLIFDKTGQVISETGSYKFIPNSIFRKGEMGFLIKNVRGNPIMAKIKSSNNISASPKLQKLVKDELINILTEFYDINTDVNVTYNKLVDLIGTNPLFKGYNVLKSKNMIIVDKSSDYENKDKNILFILYDNKNNKTRALTVFNDEGKRYISDIDGQSVEYSRFNKNYIDFAADKVLEKLQFYPSYFAFKAKGNAKYGDNRYFYKENDELIIEIGDEKLSYDTYFDLALEHNMFKVDVKYNENNNSFDFGEDSEQDLYINIDAIEETTDIEYTDKGQIDLNEAISSIEKSTTNGVYTKTVLKAFGYSDDYINLFTKYYGKDKYRIFSASLYYDDSDIEHFAKYSKKDNKIYITPLGIKEIRKEPSTLLRLLAHENIHRAVNELSAFENDYIVSELMDTYNQFVTKLTEDVNKGNKDAILIQQWINDNNFKPDNQLIKDDVDNRYFAEEWLVESTTNGALVRYLNSIEYKGIIPEVEKPTLFQKILKVLSEIFGNIFGNINKNSILVKNITIFNEAKSSNKSTPIKIDDNGNASGSPVEETPQPAQDVDISETSEQTPAEQTLNEQPEESEKSFEVELTDIDDLTGEIDDFDELDNYSAVPAIKTDIESKLNAYADNQEVNPNGYYTIRNMDDFVRMFPNKIKPKIASELDSNQIKFLCR